MNVPVHACCNYTLMAGLKWLEDERRRLKEMYAEEGLKAEVVQDALAKKVVRLSRRSERSDKTVTERWINCGWHANLRD